MSTPFDVDVLQFSASTYSITENAGSATITVTRSSNVQKTVSVAYATSNGTATAGADYGASSGVITFTAGSASAAFTIPILDDALLEGTETVSLTLSNPSANVDLVRAAAVLTLLDSEADLVAAPRMSNPPNQVGQTITATLTITNNGPSLAPSVLVTVTLPTQVQLLSAVIPGSCSGVGPLVCNLGHLDPAARRSLTLQFSPSQAGSFTLAFQVASGVTDPVPNNNQVMQPLTIAPGANPKVFCP